MNTCEECGLDGLGEDDICPVCQHDPCWEENNPEEDIDYIEEYA